MNEGLLTQFAVERRLEGLDPGTGGMGRVAVAGYRHMTPWLRAGLVFFHATARLT